MFYCIQWSDARLFIISVTRLIIVNRRNLLMIIPVKAYDNKKHLINQILEIQFSAVTYRRFEWILKEFN